MSLQPCSSEGCCTDMVPVWHPRDAMQFTYPVMFCITGHWEIFGFSVPPMLYGIPGMPSSSASCNGYLHTVWLATVRDKMWTICSQRDLPTSAQHPLFVRHPRDAKHHTARVVRYPWLSYTTVLHTTFIQYSRHHMQSYLILTVHHDAQHPLFVRHPRDAKHHTARVVRYPWLSYTTVLNIHCIILYI